MDKEVVTCTQWNIIQPLKRNTFESVLIRWINLELIIQSKVSQKEIIIIYKHIYTESRKMVQKNLFSGQQWQECGSTHPKGPYQSTVFVLVPSSGYNEILQT